MDNFKKRIYLILLIILIKFIQITLQCANIEWRDRMSEPKRFFG